jgi:hypothetical protein
MFNASKAKLTFIAPSKYRTDRLSPISEFYVVGDHTEYTDHWLHLGHIIDNSDDQEDILYCDSEIHLVVRSLMWFTF